MKKIEAIIRPEFLIKIKEELEKIGHFGITVSEVEGCGKQGGIVHQWRGEKHKIDFIPKLKIEIFAKEKDLKNILKIIIENAKTGEIGDGKVFILPCENAIRIRTGEEGENAI